MAHYTYSNFKLARQKSGGKSLVINKKCKSCIVDCISVITPNSLAVEPLNLSFWKETVHIFSLLMKNRLLLAHFVSNFIYGPEFIALFCLLVEKQRLGHFLQENAFPPHCRFLLVGHLWRCTQVVCGMA